MKLLHYKLLLLFLLLGSISPVNAQWQNGLWTEKQAYNWYFTEYNGLNFETSPPTVLNDGQIYEGGTGTRESAGAISDSDGNLLFYTDGVTIWNADHQIMENGTDLLGHRSASQGGLIVPKPGDSNIYYVFTIGNAGMNGLAYSEVDMSLDGGLGAVTENKNIVLSNFSDERVNAVYHADNNKIWILGHRGAEFMAFLLDENGINPMPVVSQVGGSFALYGKMKISPDGKKVALSSMFSSENNKLFDFNNETGIVSNPVDLTGSNGLPLLVPAYYGVEFSPNSQYLYIAYTGDFTDPFIIYQFDTTLGDQDAILGSNTIVENSISSFITSFQLGSDGKIYIANSYTNSLAVINYPNNEANSVGFEIEGVNLTNECDLGLPDFVRSYFASGILYEGDDCQGSEITFSTLRIPGIEAIAWDFGDPDSGADNASTNLEPSHIFSGPGTYTVTAVITSNGAQQTATTEVMIQPGPDAVIPAIENTSLCDEGSGSATFDLTANNQEILNGQDATLFTVTHYASEADVLAGTPIDTPDAFTTQGQTVYTQVTNTDTGCTTLISYPLTVNPNPQAAAPDTLTPCGNQEGVAIINLTDNDATILAGQDPSQFTVAYFSDAAQAESGTDPVDTPDAYDTAGETLYARVTDSATGCYSIVSFEIVIAEGDFIPGTISLTGCSPFDLTQGVEAFDPELDYSYYTNEPDALSGSDAIATPQEYPLSTGTGFVYVRAEDPEGCFDVAELVLETGDCTLPKGISPNNDGMNDSFDLTFLTGDGNGSLQVFNRYGVKVYEQGRYTNQWQGQDNSGNDLPTGTYYYVLQLQESHPDFGSNISQWVYIQREN